MGLRRCPADGNGGGGLAAPAGERAMTFRNV